MTNTAIAFLEKYFGFIFCWLLTLVQHIKALFVSAKKNNPPSQKIVFVKFIEQGALVLHQKTFREAAAIYGAENIFLCTFTSNAQVVDVLQLVPPQNRLLIEEKSILQFALSFFKALAAIRKKNIDTAIDLEFFSRATAIFCFLTGAKKRAGYHRLMGLQNYRGNLFTHRLNYSHYVHVADSSWSLLKSIELPIANLPALDIALSNTLTEISFTPTAADINKLNQLLPYDIRSEKNIIVINPSLNDVLPLRKWPEENYRNFILAFHQKFPTYKFVFTGRADEFELTANFISHLPVTGAVNLCGKTEMRDILTLYSSSKILLTTDSGPAHFASITSVQTIVLFGPETPVLYSPLSVRTHVMYEPPPCSPCYNVYNNRLSPCTNNICLQRISVNQVMAKANEICSL